MIQHLDLNILQIFLEELVILMLKNNQVVQVITTLSPEDQAFIKDFIVHSEHSKKSLQNIEDDKDNNLYDKLEEY